MSGFNKKKFARGLLADMVDRSVTKSQGIERDRWFSDYQKQQEQEEDEKVSPWGGRDVVVEEKTEEKSPPAHWKDDDFDEGARELIIDGKSYIHVMPENYLIERVSDEREFPEEVGTLNRETGKIDYYDRMKPEGFGVQTNDPTSIGKLKSMV
tara:strand:- start:100 stop:558 length:459 start_codon:yes stop_codon:yes gene_type:complete